MRVRKAIYCSFLFLFLSGEAQAEENEALRRLSEQVSALTTMVRSLQGTIEHQQQRIAELEKASMKVEAKNSPAPEIQQTPAQIAAASNPAAKAAIPFIPDIGVVGDIVGSLSESKEDEEGNDRLSVRELELVFGHDIDPYSRFDSTITFSDLESPDIEEAYVSYWDLPLDLKGKIGRMRQKIGRASAVHRDVLDTVDEPLVVQEYLGVEGLFKTGVELTGFTPLSGDSFTQQITAGFMEGGVGEDGLLFGETKRRPSFYAHIANSIDINDETNTELGATYLLGSKDEDSRYEVNAVGLDATFVHFITPMNKFKWQNEAFLQDRAESSLIADDGSHIDFDRNPWGAYSLLDYRLSERYGIGTRFDYVEPIDRYPGAPQRADRALSGYLTYYQSEFARWRLQYENADLSTGANDNRVFLQGTFAIGTHKHALQ